MMTYSFSRLTVAREGHVLRCELARPSQLNAFDAQMWHDLEAFFRNVRVDTGCRSVLLCAQGRHFTAGLDLTAMSSGLADSEGEDAARRALRIRETGKAWQRSLSNIAECGKAVVACVHGACIGAGLEMLAACDVRMCTRDARFAMAEVDVALAADVGGLQRFPKLVGNDSLVRELALTGRTFSGEDAMRIGFVSRLCESREALLTDGAALAAEIAGKSPVALLGVKTLLNYARDHSVDESLEYAITWNQAMLQTADMATAAMAKLAKQRATFDDLPELRCRL